MECSKFEDSLSDYIEGALLRPEATLFAAHALQCRECRALLDDVKATIGDCNHYDEVEASDDLQAALIKIALEHAPLDCSGFEEIITEFLDGFVPALVYHRFEAHAASCDNCSRMLTDVVYAVAACHSVHTYEECDAPQQLIDRLISVMPERRSSLRKTFAYRASALAALIIPRATANAQWTFATASLLAIATFGLLLFGFSDDKTLAGIYRQAQVKAAEVYSQSAGIYAQKDEMVAELQKVGSDIGEIWNTLGGDNQPASAIDSNPQNQNAPGKAENNN